MGGTPISQVDNWNNASSRYFSHLKPERDDWGIHTGIPTSMNDTNSQLTAIMLLCFSRALDGCHCVDILLGVGVLVGGVVCNLEIPTPPGCLCYKYPFVGVKFALRSVP